MKKTVKKLVVRRETLVDLDLRETNGGTSDTGIICGYSPGRVTYTCTDAVWILP